MPVAFLDHSSDEAEVPKGQETITLVTKGFTGRSYHELGLGQDSPGFLQLRDVTLQEIEL